MLTRKQHELLQYINRHLAERGISPSFDEMKEALGLKSKSGIHRLISGLEERGFLRRLPHRARALEVLRLPEEGDLRTPRVERCRFCVYRSLCERGVRAGPLDEIEDAAEAGEGFDFQLDFEQIAEIKL